MHTHNNSISIRAAVLTVSNTRTKANDKSGKEIQHLLVEQQHTIYDYQIMKDELRKTENV